MSETVDRIRAEAHTDDHKFNHHFDATPWFEQAKAADIFLLAKCGWGGDYPADAVAQFMSHHGETPLETMFTLLTATKDEGGFECHIDTGDAMTYLHDVRPEVYDVIRRELGDAGSPPNSTKAEARLTHQECGCKIGQSVHTHDGSHYCEPQVQLADQAARAVGVRIAFGIEWHGDGRIEGCIDQEWSVAAENLTEPLRSQVLALAHQAAGQQEVPAMDCGCPIGTKNKQHTC